KKEGLNYITKSVIGKKYQGSTGDDDGNDILFKKVSFDHEFGELELEGTIKYKAESFDFEGLLEPKNKDLIGTQSISTPLHYQDKNKKNRTKQKRHSRRKHSLFIKAEIEDLPVHFSAYVKANRVFLSEIKQYQNM